MIADYMHYPFAINGRGPDSFDCYGLVRAVRMNEFDKPFMEQHRELPTGSFRGMTREVVKLRECDREDGAIACAWRGKICFHIGVVVTVDGIQWILDTSEATGPKLTRPAAFERQYTRVTYCD